MFATTPASLSRRRLLTSATVSALARPALVSNARVLRFAPASNLTYVDPTFNPIAITTTHAFMVFDQLYGLDSQLRRNRKWPRGTRFPTTAAHGPSACATGSSSTTARRSGARRGRQHPALVRAR